MARGTFANIQLINKFIGKAAPKTIHIPSGEAVSYKYFTIYNFACTIIIHGEFILVKVSLLHVLQWISTC